MRNAAFLGTAFLMLADCGASGDDSASGADSEPAPTPAMAPAATAAEGPIAAKVIFDGVACSYSGPAVVADGTSIRTTWSLVPLRRATPTRTLRLGSSRWQVLETTLISADPATSSDTARVTSNSLSSTVRPNYRR
jgi:hypothetical protein